MNWVIITIALALGFALGLATALVLKIIQGKSARELADEIYRTAGADREKETALLLESVKTAFGSLSLEALSKSTDEFMKLARSKLEGEREHAGRELEGKKELIDRELKRLTEGLVGVSDLVKNLEKDRASKFGELAQQLRAAGEQTALLMQTTQSLKEALASTKARGQWGERMAEDVLRLIGFVENINYVKQKRIEGHGTQPDFTFLLPRGLKLNMDVKFPLVNYIRFLECQNDGERTRCKGEFIKDVKTLFKQVTTREYINPEQNTLDYMLLFIPNEQIYAFILEHDAAILEEGLKNKIIFCSPVTLFAVLLVIRQAVDNFSLEKTSNEILALFGAFRRQWDDFLKKLETMGKRIEDAQKEFESLMTTRRRGLEKPLNRIEELRVARNIPVDDSLPNE